MSAVNSNIRTEIWNAAFNARFQNRCFQQYLKEISWKRELYRLLPIITMAFIAIYAVLSNNWSSPIWADILATFAGIVAVIVSFILSPPVNNSFKHEVYCQELDRIANDLMREFKRIDLGQEVSEERLLTLQEQADHLSKQSLSIKQATNREWLLQIYKQIVREVSTE